MDGHTSSADFHDDELCNTCKDKDCKVTNTKGETQVLDAKWIQCDSCKGWHHGMCQNLAKSEVNTIIKLEIKGVRWFCDECRSKPICANTSNTDIPLVNSLDERFNRIEQQMHKLTSSITSQESRLDTKLEMIEKSYASVLKSNTENIQKSIEVNSSAKTILQKSLAQTENETRKLNAILYGLPEEKDKSSAEQIKEFMKHTCFQHTNIPAQAFRLGKILEGKTRPIKVIFEDEKTKWAFITRVNSSLKGENYFCKPDTSKEFREQEYALRQQVKSLRSNNTDISYRIRSMKIQQKNPESGDWVALLPTKTKTTTC